MVGNVLLACSVMVLLLSLHEAILCERGWSMVCRNREAAKPICAPYVLPEVLPAR